MKSPPPPPSIHSITTDEYYEHVQKIRYSSEEYYVAISNIPAHGKSPTFNRV